MPSLAHKPPRRILLFKSLGCLPRTQTARINDGHASYFAEVPCFLAPQDWSSSGASGASLHLVLGLHPPPIDNGVILYRKGGRNRVRKKLSHPAYKPPPPPHFVLRLRLQRGGIEGTYLRDTTVHVQNHSNIDRCCSHIGIRGCAIYTL